MLRRIVPTAHGKKKPNAHDNNPLATQQSTPAAPSAAGTYWFIPPLVGTNRRNLRLHPMLDQDGSAVGCSLDSLLQDVFQAMLFHFQTQ